MWHEARKQERKIRGMLVDYRRRAERRRDFYEKIKADPTQFLQVHGRQCKIHLDPAIAAAADSAVMMPWQGQTDNLIDRFDVRAHLDYIPPVKNVEEASSTQEERQLNYERYRIIAQNSFLAVTEEKFLKQLHLEEQFGYTEKPAKKERTGGAAIGFNYEEGTAINQPEQSQENNDEESGENSDSDVDVDLAINVSKMDPSEAHEMNKHGHHFGMSSNDFYSFLTGDLEEAESYRLAKEEEHEKALFSGRKSRRERRAHREKRLANRIIDPPSYAAQVSPTANPLLAESRSPSRSPSPENTGKITYITSFGDDEEGPSTSKPTYADKVKYGKPKVSIALPKRSSTERIVYRRRSRSKSRSRSRSRSNASRERNVKRRKQSRSRSRSRSRRSRTRSSSRSRKSRSRSRSNSREKFNRSSKSSNLRRRRRRTSSSSPSSSSLSSSSSSSSSSRDGGKKRISPRAKTRSKSRSRSSSRSSSSESTRNVKAVGTTDLVKKVSPPKAIPRYYGRKKSDQSSSELSEASDDDKNGDNLNSNESKSSGILSGNSSAKRSGPAMTIIERLKRKRQALLNKQFKADKIAEQIKTEREKQEQQTREDELREMLIKFRKRQREKRHANESKSSDSSGSDSDSKSSKSKPEKDEKSRSPTPKKEKDREPRKRDYREDRDEKDRERNSRRDRSRDRSRDRDRRSSRDRNYRRNSRDRDRVRRYSPKRKEERVIYRDDKRYDRDRDRDRNYRSNRLVDY